jgi:hypothetical protein
MRRGPDGYALFSANLRAARHWNASMRPNDEESWELSKIFGTRLNRSL